MMRFIFTTTMGRIARLLLGVYIVILGLLFAHPLIDSELHHHSDHVCQTETHYHQTPIDCVLCHFAFPNAENSEPYTIEELLPLESAQLYATLTTNTFTTTPYRYLLRGPPAQV